MKSIVLYNSPVHWLSLFPEPYLFEPCIHSNVFDIEKQTKEDASGYTFEYQLPDFHKRDLELLVNNGRIELRGNHTKSKSGFLGRNKLQSTVSFSRDIAIVDDMDTDKLKAKFRNGVLTVSIPKKKETARYREINVTADDDKIEDSIDNTDKRSIIEKLSKKISSVFTGHNNK